ncbi:NlpC/P60 family protein [Vibrio sp. ZSDZ34]|uniref:NlpC/P60 family protein n=1 Tax=Vibrio gelatinilyticus TaxID=2893468 RepID=A0A9X1W9U9_9VIBR|nr:NlpC/P60 family protein [Vibrio gelatinilyticus]MCJ2376653.1 NlpC/P60 family protein [Vibrio gelatinilyticus]
MKIDKCCYFSLLVMALAGCSSTPTHIASSQIHYNEIDSSKFLEEYQKWQGVPYRLGGTGLNGVDCSAFVQAVFKDAYALALPRTTAQQVKYGQRVDYNEAQTGHLVFFKTGRSLRHVGIYIGNNAFMHASTSKGVVISRLDNPYWASTFWQFRRVQ